jgi:hypothetical protein
VATCAGKPVKRAVQWWARRSASSCGGGSRNHSLRSVLPPRKTQNSKNLFEKVFTCRSGGGRGRVRRSTAGASSRRRRPRRGPTRARAAAGGSRCAGARPRRAPAPSARATPTRTPSFRCEEKAREFAAAAASSLFERLRATINPRQQPLCPLFACWLAIFSLLLSFRLANGAKIQMFLHRVFFCNFAHLEV